ncbi:MAG: hypothetical protein IJX16_00295 [Clostridia bacterium]|nr:hypothetical protein [Clostridia bacterium]
MLFEKVKMIEALIRNKVKGKVVLESCGLYVEVRIYHSLLNFGYTIDAETLRACPVDFIVNHIIAEYKYVVVKEFIKY